jgi:hypothetical protein
MNLELRASSSGNQNLNGIDPEQIDGIATQFGGPSGDLCDVVIGFDFGTSSTKVIVRTPFYFSGRGFAVPFDTLGHPTNPYLLASNVRLGRDGRFSLGDKEHSLMYRDIKRGLVKAKRVKPLGGPGEAFAPEIPVIAFLALVLRKVRSWFFKSQRNLYWPYQMKWHLHIGLPSADYSDVELYGRYKQAARAAWVLSTQAVSVTPQSVKTILDEIKNPIIRDEIPEIDMFPEVSVQMVGYAKSHQRKEGLHILVDVGASTLDICGFILTGSEADDRYALLTTDVQMLGTLALHERRAAKILTTVPGSQQHDVRRHQEQLWKYLDPVSPMPNKAKEFVPADITVPEETLQNVLYEADEDHCSDCSKRLWGTVYDLKTKRAAKATCWRRTLPVFLCGGGNRVVPYQNMLGDFEDEYPSQYGSNSQGVSRLSLPKPSALVADVDPGTYHRLAVAWGLSHTAEDIGSIIRPQDISDQPMQRYETPEQPRYW